MSIGPNPGFADAATVAVDQVTALQNCRANRERIRIAARAVYALAVDANDLAQAASDLLYLLESDPPDSDRITLAMRILRKRANHPIQLWELVKIPAP